MKFWVDMDNAPHVHVLRPIILELERRGHQVEVTARDFGQTLPLLRMYGLDAKRVGRHWGKNRVKKYLSFITRSLLLLFYGMGRGFDAVLCHGSRAVFPAAWLLRLPLISMCDYEHAALPRFMTLWQRLILVPSVIPREVFLRKGLPDERICGHPGLKEDLYIHDFQPDPTFLREMGIDEHRVLVLVRPPATMAHYAVAESGALFHQVLAYLGGRADLQLLLLPRTGEQGRELQNLVGKCGYENILFPDRVYNGPNLIWHSDLVISGGGTMNREAASLGVPVVSIYQGPIGAVDRHLIETGKLVHVKDIEDLKKIPLAKVDRKDQARDGETGRRVRDFIVDRLVETASGGRASS